MVTEIASVFGSIVKALECAICLRIPSDPVSVGCGHFFCRECIATILRRNIRAACPLCMKMYTKRSIREAVQRKLICNAVVSAVEAIDKQLKIEVSSVGMEWKTSQSKVFPREENKKEEAISLSKEKSRSIDEAGYVDVQKKSCNISVTAELCEVTNGNESQSTPGDEMCFKNKQLSNENCIQDNPQHHVSLNDGIEFISSKPKNPRYIASNLSSIKNKSTLSIISSKETTDLHHYGPLEESVMHSENVDLSKVSSASLSKKGALANKDIFVEFRSEAFNKRESENHCTLQQYPTNINETKCVTENNQIPDCAIQENLPLKACVELNNQSTNAAVTDENLSRYVHQSNTNKELKRKFSKLQVFSANKKQTISPIELFSSENDAGQDQCVGVIQSGNKEKDKKESPEFVDGFQNDLNSKVGTLKNDINSKGNKEELRAVQTHTEKCIREETQEIDNDNLPKLSDWSKIKQMNRDFHLRTFPSLHVQRNRASMPQIKIKTFVQGENSITNQHESQEGASKEHFLPNHDSCEQNEKNSFLVNSSKDLNLTDEYYIAKGTSLKSNNVEPLKDICVKFFEMHAKVAFCGISRLNKNSVSINKSALESLNIVEHPELESTVPFSVQRSAVSYVAQNDSSVSFANSHNKTNLDSNKFEKNETHIKGLDRTKDASCEMYDKSDTNKALKTFYHNLGHDLGDKLHSLQHQNMKDSSSHRIALTKLDLMKSCIKPKKAKGRVSSELRSEKLAKRKADISEESKVVKRVCLTLEEILFHFNNFDDTGKTQTLCNVSLPFSDLNLQLTVSDQTLNVSVLKVITKQTSQSANLPTFESTNVLSPIKDTDTCNENRCTSRMTDLNICKKVLGKKLPRKRNREFNRNKGRNSVETRLASQSPVKYQKLFSAANEIQFQTATARNDKLRRNASGECSHLSANNSLKGITKISNNCIGEPNITREFSSMNTIHKSHTKPLLQTSTLISDLAVMNMTTNEEKENSTKCSFYASLTADSEAKCDKQDIARSHNGNAITDESISSCSTNNICKVGKNSNQTQVLPNKEILDSNYANVEARVLDNPNLEPMSESLKEDMFLDDIDPFADTCDFDKHLHSAQFPYEELVKESEVYASDPHMQFANNLVAPLRGMAKAKQAESPGESFKCSSPSLLHEQALRKNKRYKRITTLSSEESDFSDAPTQPLLSKKSEDSLKFDHCKKAYSNQEVNRCDESMIYSDDASTGAVDLMRLEIERMSTKINKLEQEMTIEDEFYQSEESDEDGVENSVTFRRPQNYKHLPGEVDSLHSDDSKESSDLFTEPIPPTPPSNCRRNGK